MTRHARLAAALGAMLVALTTGCTQQISTVKMASTDLVDLSATYTLAASGVTAASPAVYVILFYDGEDPSYYKALGECLAQYNGDVLTDVEVTQSSYWFVIGVYSEYRVTGNVWKKVDSMSQYTPDELFRLETVDGQSRLVSLDGRESHRVDMRQG